MVLAEHMGIIYYDHGIEMLILLPQWHADDIECRHVKENLTTRLSIWIYVKHSTIIRRNKDTNLPVEFIGIGDKIANWIQNKDK